MQTFKQHAIDFIKGLLAAMLASACLSGLQYIGAHIPDLIGFVATTAAATTTIRVTR